MKSHVTSVFLLSLTDTQDAGRASHAPCCAHHSFFRKRVTWSSEAVCRLSQELDVVPRVVAATAKQVLGHGIRCTSLSGDNCGNVG